MTTRLKSSDCQNAQAPYLWPVQQVMVKVIDRQRKLPNLKAERVRPNGEWSPVYRCACIRRKRLGNLAAAVSYLLQSFWPSRRSTLD